MWAPLNLTSIEWTPFSWGMKRMVCLSVGQRVGEGLCSSSPRPPAGPGTGGQGQGQLTAVQLRHVALLHRARGRVHASIDHAPGTIQLHCKGRRLVHLEPRLLQRPQRVLRLLGGSGAPLSLPAQPGGSQPRPGPAQGGSQQGSGRWGAGPVALASTCREVGPPSYAGHGGG